MMNNTQQELIQNEQQFVKGRVKSVFFQSNDSFYKVILISVKETNFDWKEHTITVTGDFANLQEENEYRFIGHVVDHPRYGKQFKAETYEVDVPDTTEGLVHYFSSDKFPGIGKKSAERIIKILGDDALNLLIQDPERAQGLGLSSRQAQTLIEGIKDNNQTDTIIIGLNNYGFSSKISAKIFAKYHEKSLTVINENPYQLSIDIDGIGFVKADQIAIQIGIKDDSAVRIRGAIFQVLNDLCYESGNTYATSRQVIENAITLLEKGRQTAIDPEMVADQIIELEKKHRIVADQQHIYVRRLYHEEHGIANKLYTIATNQDQKNYDEKKLAKILRRIERHLGIQYDDIQQDAIFTALNSRCFLLTGGPGTGKTTIINGIVAMFAELNGIDLERIRQQKDDSHLPILLAAPTGRAAKRMTETTGLPARTIHRLLGINGHDEELSESKVDELSGDLLIIDETSMVDTELMDVLLGAIPYNMQVIFVGDKDQLPSVGPGQVFADLLESDELPKKELTRIYRQSDDSSIVELSHSIQQGQLPPDFTQQHADRSFIACNAFQVPDVLEQVVQLWLSKENSIDDLQVLAPMYKGVAGIDNLNNRMQAIVNPAKRRRKEVQVNQQVFRIGDRVLQLVNDPEHNIFNGDIGKVIGIDLKSAKNHVPTDKIIVDFDGNEVGYEKRNWNQLTLAYCMSIHKSQGGEFPLIILPMVRQFSRMFARNLLYTAVSRAKQKLVLLGEVQAFKKSVSIVSSNRQTGLKEMLWEAFGDHEKVNLIEDPVSEGESETAEADDQELNQNSNVLTNSMIESGKIDPLIGMNGIRPKDFMETKQGVTKR